MGNIPSNDAEFNNTFRNVSNYVSLRTGGGDAQWNFIPAADVIAMQAAFTEWTTYYTPTLSPHTPGVTKSKNLARKRTEKVLRKFIQRFLMWEPVTDADRVNMNLSNHDTIRTQHFTVDEDVAVTLSIRRIREVVVNFKVKDAIGTAKPRGYKGVKIMYDVLNEAPSGLKDLKRSVDATRTPHSLLFDEQERGKTIYISVAWQNSRGILGQWSPIVKTIIP